MVEGKSCKILVTSGTYIYDYVMDLILSACEEGDL